MEKNSNALSNSIKIIEILKVPCSSKSGLVKDKFVNASLKESVHEKENFHTSAAQLLAHFSSELRNKHLKSPKRGQGTVAQVQISGGTAHSKTALEIIARFETLKALDDARLCKYFDIQQTSQTDLLLLCQDHLSSPPLVSLAEFITSNNVPVLQDKAKTPNLLEFVAFLKALSTELVLALDCLHKKNIVCRNLSPENIYLEFESPLNLKNIVLTNYGLYYMSGGGLDVPFMIGSPQYLPPEVYDAALETDHNDGKSADSWSLGMCLLAVLTKHSTSVLGGQSQVTLADRIDAVIEFKWTEELELSSQIIDSDFADFLKQCLNCYAPDRPVPSELLGHRWIHKQEPAPAEEVKQYSLITSAQAYYLWKSQYKGQLEFALQTEGIDLYHSKILCAPSALPLSKNRRTSFYSTAAVSFLPFDTSPFRIDISNVKPKLCNYSDIVSSLDNTPTKSFEAEIHPRDSESDPSPFVDHQSMLSATSLDWAYSEDALSSSSSLQRETNIAFQSERIAVFNKLLLEYPASLHEIQVQAVKGLSSLHRSSIWAALLNIRSGYEWDYCVDSVSQPHDLDRQLDVDIPRCHQYNELLASRIGQKKMFRVLKVWIQEEAKSNYGCVYWQGMDSLCAPFLVINFTDEALAFCAFRRFVQRFCAGMYVSDNSKMLQVTMRTFEALLQFHDAELWLYFDSMKLTPELYTMSWFMTKFTHILHLDKIFQLFDLLLINPPYFFLFIGLAILLQRRSELLEMDFNKAMLTLSDVSDNLNFENLTNYSRLLSARTPIGLFAPFLHTTIEFSNPTETAYLQEKFADVLDCERNLSDTWSVPNISFKELELLLPFSLVIDLRGIDEFKKSHIPYSIAFDSKDAAICASKIELLKPDAQSRGRLVVLYGSPEVVDSVRQAFISFKISRVVSFTKDTQLTSVEHKCRWTISSTILNDKKNSATIHKCNGKM